MNGISLTWWTLQIKLDGVYTGLSHIEPVPGVYLLGDHSRDGYTCRAAGQADNMQEVVKHLAVAHPDPSIFAWLRKEEQVALAWAGVQEQVRRAQIASWLQYHCTFKVQPFDSGLKVQLPDGWRRGEANL